MELVLHIGAHRTGSTMVERTITASIAAHPDCGVSLWAPRRLRDMEGFQSTTRLLDEEAEPVDKDAAVALDELATRIAADLAQERAQGVTRLILSEENFMGGMRNNFRRGEFYGDVARRLAAYDSLLPMSPTHIALGVRDYGAVWSSAYHYLPQVGQVAPPAERVRDGLLNDRRGWPEVAEAVAQIWPESELIMWQQEQLSDALVPICSAVSGLPPDVIEVPEGKINARKDVSDEIELFSKEERKHLSHRYNRHIRRLKSDSAVTWIGAAV